MPSSAAALIYHEPGIVTVLVLSSFILLENVVNDVLDRFIYCGLIGQISMGVAWGTPGGNWLSDAVENTVMQLGYLGLVLLVYEGGLSTDLKTARSRFLLSSLVALIGISAPMALSFVLQGFMNITHLEAFAAGAALCSTSLGTIFTILSTSGLSQSQLGVVLSSAAMMDDIVGLVMSGIIARLGKSSGFSAVTVIRPIFVSIAFAVLLPLICLFIARPVTKCAFDLIASERRGKLANSLMTEGAALAFHTLLLLALVTSASYAGTSILFAAYLAGASSTWWDGLCQRLSKTKIAAEPPNECVNSGSKPDVRPANLLSAKSDSRPNNSKRKHQQSKRTEHAQPLDEASTADQPKSSEQSGLNPDSSAGPNDLRATTIFKKYYHPPLHTILKPFFFASIGFSIPVSHMFRGAVIWKGFIYAILMAFAKLLCGLFLLPFPSPPIFFKMVKRHLPLKLPVCWPPSSSSKAAKVPRTQKPLPNNTTGASQSRPSSNSTEAPPSTSQTKRPESLYPAVLVGCAMVARGEIGFLISSVAESNGVFGANSNEPSELFLVVTWAILLCTLMGPIATGLIVKRVKRLQAAERDQLTGREDPLGPWGFIPATK